MVLLRVVQKIMKRNLKVMVIGIGNKKRERIPEFCRAINLTDGNMLFKNSASQSIIYEFDPSKRKNQRT